jgi:hypothetical protein
MNIHKPSMPYGYFPSVSLWYFMIKFSRLQCEIMTS